MKQPQLKNTFWKALKKKKKKQLLYIQGVVANLSLQILQILSKKSCDQAITNLQ